MQTENIPAAVEPEVMHPRRRNSKATRAVLLLVLVVASWASATVASKHLFNDHSITPFTLVVWRFTLAGSCALVLFSLGQGRRGTRKLPLAGGWRVYLLGAFLISIFILGFNLALLYISATLGGLFFFGLNPIIMLVVGRWWLGTGFGWRQVIGISIALVGLVIVLSGGDLPHLWNSLSQNQTLPGLGLMALASIGWGVYGLWGKRYGNPLPGAALLSTGINQLVGVLPVWVLALILEPQNIFAPKPEAWLIILYIGIVPSALGFALFYAILKDLTVNQAATIQLFSPVFTALMAILFLGEPFTLALVIGTLVLLWGVRYSSLQNKPLKK